MATFTLPAQLRGRRLMIATPCYGGETKSAYTQSLITFVAACSHLGVEVEVFMIHGEALVCRARNYCCDAFLRSEATDLIFIDADIQFEWSDVLELSLHLSEPNSFDVLAVPCPRKRINWNKIHWAAGQGVVAADLEKFGGDFIFSPSSDRGSPKQICEVTQAGTGLMMMPRRTLTLLEEAFPEFKYSTGIVGDPQFDGRRLVAFFQTEIDKKTDRYLSEDFFFTQKCRQIGMRIGSAPWVRTQHIGPYTFGGGGSPGGDLSLALESA